MSETSVALAEGETRHAMIRVWMAISAIWVAFWLSLAALIAVTGEMAGPLVSQLPLFALIVMVPPVLLLAFGAAFRWAVAALFRKGTDA
jgi:hypothetical protein